MKKLSQESKRALFYVLLAIAGVGGLKIAQDIKTRNASK